jgi:tRNA (cmo5U34)-methyltransferase
MLQTQGTRPVHFPANPNVFEFDAEVSRIFPDMAQRSIPMYHEAHRAHVAMVAGYLSTGIRSVLDIGASRGAFFAHLKDQPTLKAQIDAGYLRLTGVDPSPHMCNMLAEEHPEVEICEDTLTNFVPASHPDWRSHRYDVVVLNYVLQFIEPEFQRRAFQQAMRLVAPGGYLFYGHKERLPGLVGELAQEEYIEFRVRNGYTREEIVAKTKALKGAMYTVSNDTIIDWLKGEGFEVTQTTRWMAFNTLAARRGL